MSRRRSRRLGTGPVVPHVDPSTAWTRSEEYVGPTGRHLRRGVEFSVHGERGRFRFLEHVRTPEGVEWLTAAGGTKGVTMTRSFAPDRVKRVHVGRTTMTPSEARELAARKRAEKAAS